MLQKDVPRPKDSLGGVDDSRPRTACGFNDEERAKEILARIKDEEIEWVDLRFTDPKGKWQRLTMVASLIGEDELEDGLMFDGSSIEGWKAINESDMILMPDLDSHKDPNPDESADVNGMHEPNDATQSGHRLP